MNQKGFGLVLLLLSMVILAGLSLGSYSFYMGRSKNTQGSYSNIEDQAKEAQKAFEQRQQLQNNAINEIQKNNLTPTPTPGF